MAEVRLQDVGKTFPGGVRAVRDFSIEVPDGELVVLVGPSGCGKSTTLRMIAGLEQVSSGTISIGGRVVNEVRPKDRDIAMVFQNYALYPHMTVRGNMAFALKLRKFSKSEIDQRVQQAAKVLGLEDLLQRRPNALSGGQRQRVAVGRAIVRKPAVFLLDEPLSNLDAKLRVQMRVEIRQLHRRLGATMIYVTHDQVEAMTMGDRIVVMKDGLMQQVADPMTLYESPANKFVAGFIGMPPMNFLEGRIDRLDGRAVLITDGGLKLPLPTAKAETLAQCVGRSITLGLRPEHLGSTAAEQAPDAPRIEARVDVIEPMGAESYVYLSVNGQTLVGRVDPQRKFQIGQTAQVPLLIDKAHFFDTATETAIG